MSEAKKFLLLDPNNFNRISEMFEKKERFEPLVNKELYRLDREMLKIINDATLTESQKVNKYNSALTEFQTLSDKNFKPSPPRENMDPTSEKRITKSYDPIANVPNSLKAKASDLMDLLQKGNMTVSKDGEISLNNALIPGSNITKLLNKSVNPKIKSHSLRGWDQFQTYLTTIDIPDKLLSKTTKAEVELLKQTLPSSNPQRPTSSPQKPKSKRTNREKGLTRQSPYRWNPY